MFDYECEGNMTIFDFMYPTFQIDKPIRLIETFAGVGSQAMALRDIGASFEHYKIVEWEVNAFASYKAIHMSDDFTDYSTLLDKKHLIEILSRKGISNDGKNPMTKNRLPGKTKYGYGRSITIFMPPIILLT